MLKRGTPYKGLLFAGLMICEEGEAKVIEFNVRLGDPETQTLLPLMEDDLVPYLQAACTRGGGVAVSSVSSLSNITLKKGTAVHVVMASKHYPSLDGPPLQTGGVITYPADLLLQSPNGHLFFAGVKKKEGHLANSGGRALGVTSLGRDLREAREKAYACLEHIHFPGAHFRRDIGESKE